MSLAMCHYVVVAIKINKVLILNSYVIIRVTKIQTTSIMLL